MKENNLNDITGLAKTFAQTSVERLLLSKRRLKTLVTKNRDPSSVNGQIIERYLIAIEEKEEDFQKNHEISMQSVETFDVSELEGDISVLLEDLVLNGKDKDGSYQKMKQVFRDIGVYLVFYPSISLESPKLALFPDILFIGIPGGIYNESLYFPLVFHEIGHSLIDSTSFTSCSEALKQESERLRFQAQFGSNLSRVNTRYLDKSKFYLHLIHEWIPEIASDIFGAYMAGQRYLYSFLLYQLNKRYFSTIEDHPSNKLRFVYLVNYLQRNDGLDGSLYFSNFLDFINSDKKLDDKSKFLYRNDIQEMFFKDFKDAIERNNSLKVIKEKVRELLK